MPKITIELGEGENIADALMKIANGGNGNQGAGAPDADNAGSPPEVVGGSDNSTPEPAKNNASPDSSEAPAPAGSGGSDTAGAGDTQAQANGASQTQPASESPSGASGKTKVSVVPDADGFDVVSSLTADDVAGMSADQINANWDKVSQVINLS